MKVKLDKSIQEYLEEFDLSEREIIIYITLLKTGPNTIMNLARETGVKRSTTHNNVEELIKKGLVSQTNYGERRMVIAEDPSKLKFLMQQKKWRVEKMEGRLPTIIDEISKMVPDSKENTDVEVKYYEGISGVEYIYRMAFESAELRSYVNLAEVAKSFPENSILFISEHSKVKEDKRVVKEIIDNSKESLTKAEDFKKNTKNFEYRVMTKAIDLSSVDTLIFDNKVAMINFSDNIMGTVISNQQYYKNSKALFDFIWDTLAPQK